MIKRPCCCNGQKRGEHLAVSVGHSYDGGEETLSARAGPVGVEMKHRAEACMSSNGGRRCRMSDDAGENNERAL